MVEPTDGEKQPEQDGEQPGVGKFLYKMALMGVGGFILAQEEISAALRRKGDGEGEESEELPGTESEHSEPAGTDAVDATIDRVLRTLHVPSRADVEDVSRKIDELSARVEALRLKAGPG